MNTEPIEAITNAVLYEGYILYPYRPCIKNRRRWMFGCVAPRARAKTAGERWAMQTECLVTGNWGTRIEAEIRFLQLVDRRLAQRGNQGPEGESRPDKFEFVDSCEFDGTAYQSWQEAKERRIAISPQPLSELWLNETRTLFAFPAQQEVEALSDSNDFVFVRENENVEGLVTIAAREVASGLFCVTVRIENTTPVSAVLDDDRAHLELSTLVSAHTILALEGGQFLSATDPPEEFRQEATRLKNDGTWPVLVGDERQRNLILSSPIILYDYPQVAAESPGDWFDATEIDEMLDLRTRTLTDNEKQWMRSIDERARRLLERTERAEAIDLANLHGTLRGMRRLDTADF